MMRSWWLVFAVLAVALGMSVGSPVKADDDVPKKGRFSIELGITPKGVTMKFDLGIAMPESPAVIDTICPNIVPAYVQTLLQRVQRAFTQPSGMQAIHAEVERDKQVSQLFEVGEIFRRTGRIASARPYYQRAYEASPSSALGRLALERLGEIESRLMDAEESSEADPEALFHEMRDRTIPLGLAQQATY